MVKRYSELKVRFNTSPSEQKDLENIKRGYIKFMLIKTTNPNHDPRKED